MKLPKNFLKLPFQFDVESLQKDFLSLPKDAWAPHPDRAQSHSVRLIAPYGVDGDALLGPMQATHWLEKLPYIQKVMQCLFRELDVVIGRSRFMILDPHSNVPIHTDGNYYWSKHTRVHIPIFTNDQVYMNVSGRDQHFGVGECWTLDTWNPHGVFNKSKELRVHLVIDVVPTTKLFLSASSQRHYFCEARKADENILFRLETNFSSKVLHYEELNNTILFLVDNTRFKNEQQSRDLIHLLRGYFDRWRSVYLNVGETKEFINLYLDLNHHVNQVLSEKFSDIYLDNTNAFAKRFKIFSFDFVNQELYEQESIPINPIYQNSN